MNGGGTVQADNSSISSNDIASAGMQAGPQKSDDDLIYESIPAKSQTPEASQPQPPNPEATAVVDDTPF